MASDNPFLQSTRQHLDFFSLINNKAGPIKEEPERNVFKKVEPLRNEDRENNKIMANVNQNFKQPNKPISIQNVLFKPKAEPPPPLLVIQSVKQNIQLELQIANYNCPITKHSPASIASLQGTSSSNLLIKLPQSMVQSINDQMRVNWRCLKSFSKLYAIIKHQNTTFLHLFQRLKARSKNFMREIRLPRQQMNRFKQGLYFYYQIDRAIDAFLMGGLRDHIFRKLCESVSRYFSVDILRAYYLVRNIHEEQQLIKEDATSFVIERSERVEVIEEDKAINLITAFLHKDKINLLSCYELFLQQERPSFLTKNQQIDILWGNVANFDRESPQIQRKIVAVFQLYWNQASDKERQQKSQLFLIKQTMNKANVPIDIRNRLITIGMSNILNKQYDQIRQNDFQGNFRPLYRLFIRQSDDDFNFREQQKVLREIQLTKGWIRHVENYLQNTKFIGNMDMLIDKCVYLSAFILKLKESKHLISSKHLTIFVNEIFKNSLIILGIIILYNFNLLENCEQYLPLLLKTSEQDLNRKYSMTIQARKYVCSSFGGLNTIMTNYLALIKKILIKKIEADDILNLQQIISKGRIYSHNFQDEGSNKFVFFTVYCQCLQKFPSFIEDTQLHIQQLVLALLKKRIRVQGSLEVYHKKIMQFGRSYEHFLEYLRFITTKFIQKDTAISYISDIIERISRFGSHEIEESIEIANIMGQSIISQQNKSTIPLSYIYNEFTLKLIKNILSARHRVASIELYSKFVYLAYWVAYWSRLVEHDFIPLYRELIKLKDEIDLRPLQRNFIREEAIPVQIQLFNLIWNKREQRQLIAIRKQMEGICMQHHRITQQNFLEILTLISENHPNFLLLVFNKHFDKWESIYKSTAQSSSLEIDRMVTFPKILLNNANSANIPQLKNMHNVLVDKVSQSIKGKKISMMILNKFMPILASSMNRVDYASHVKVLGRCIQGKRLDELKLGVFTTEYFVTYLNYLICLFQVRCKRNAYSGQPKEIIQNIELFEIFMHLFLVHSSMNPISIECFSQYLHRYYSIIILNLKDLRLSSDMISKLTSLQRRCLQITKESTVTQSLLRKIRQVLARKAKLDVNDDEQLDKERIAKQYNSISFEQLLLSYLKQKDSTQKEALMQKLHKYLQNCEKYKVSIQYDIKIERLLSFNLPTKLVSQLLRRLNKQKNRAIIVKIFRIYLGQLSIGGLVMSQQLRLKQLTTAVSIINELIGSCLLSPLLIAKDKALRSSVEAVIQQCRRGIKFWNYKPTFQPAKTLESISLINLRRDEQMSEFFDQSRIEHFSVWSYTMLGLKLDLIEEVISLHQQLNGLFTAHLKLLLEDLIFATELYAEVGIRCSQKQLSSKLQSARDFLKKQDHMLKSKSQQGILILDLKQMKYQSRAIVQKIAVLDLQTREKLYNLIQKFKE